MKNGGRKSCDTLPLTSLSGFLCHVAKYWSHAQLCYSSVCTLYRQNKLQNILIAGVLLLQLHTDIYKLYVYRL